MTLHKCRECGGDAWEQTRGQLKDQDALSKKRNLPPGKDEKGWVPPWTMMNQEGSNHERNAPDTRIICQYCDNSTGWMDGTAVDYMRFVWNRDNPEGEHGAAD